MDIFTDLEVCLEFHKRIGLSTTIVQGSASDLIRVEISDDKSFTTNMWFTQAGKWFKYLELP